VLPRWVKNLHRSLLLGDAGRWGGGWHCAGHGRVVRLVLVLLLRRMGGWHKLAARVRGTLAQRTHVVAGRVVLAVLCLTSLTALTMSASTLGLVALEAGTEPDVVSVAPAAMGQAAARPLPGAQASAARPGGARLAQTEFPRPCRPRRHLEGGHHPGHSWIDQYSGQMLAWQGATVAQR
jgi:sulfite reductase (NADPH) flavoprotein alpha-component